MLFKQQSYLLRFVISVIEHGLRQTHIEELLLRSRRCQPLLVESLDTYRLTPAGTIQKNG
ncbi:Secreted protein [Vibrio neptunius]